MWCGGGLYQSGGSWGGVEEDCSRVEVVREEWKRTVAEWR